MNYLLTTVAVAAILGIFFYLSYEALSLPVVQLSNKTQECVRVLPEGSCSHLPQKYILEYVK